MEEDDNGDMDEEDDNPEDSEEGCRDIKPESRHSSDSTVKPPYSYVAMIGKYEPSLYMWSMYVLSRSTITN